MYLPTYLLIFVITIYLFTNLFIYISMCLLPYSHKSSPPINFRPPGGLKLKGANWEPKFEAGRKLKGANWAPKIGGAKIKGGELVTEI